MEMNDHDDHMLDTSNNNAADNSTNLGEESTRSRKRARKQTSQVWDSFEMLPLSEDGKQRAIFTKCKQKYIAEATSGTTSMLRHTRNCLGRVVEIPHHHVDQTIYREKLANLVIKHNVPFMHVEHEGVRDLHRYLNPGVKCISRNTAVSDVVKIYSREKENLKKMLEKTRSKICLTSDLWSSSTSDGYLALTAHYVDDNWTLQKKFLTFHHIPPPHSGPVLAERIIHFLKEWGIDKNIFTITLDNAKYNDGLVGSLKQHFSLTKSLVCDGKFLHIRCGAHILNLIVQDGLKVIGDAIHSVRESVKYARSSEARKIKFAECMSSTGSKILRQDVVTRWNSTFLMLESALNQRNTFSQLKLMDTSFNTCPSDEEWGYVERITKFLKPFYEITTLFCGCRYPTANLYFRNVWKIQLLIEEMENEVDVLGKMAREMKAKFDKYWSSYSLILSFAIILDPRYKLQFVQFAFKKLNSYTYLEKVAYVHDSLKLLFDEYMESHSVSHPSSTSATIVDMEENALDEMDEFDLYDSQEYVSNRSKSQLELYLDEPRLNRKEHAKLDILNYWKGNKDRYPQLASMVLDIMCIPITTVASESAFSIGSQVYSKFRSSILPKHVEAVICSRDWLNCYQSTSDEEEEELLIEDFEPILKSLHLI